MLGFAINAYIALFCAVILFVIFMVHSLTRKREKKLKVDNHFGDYEVGTGSDSDDSLDRNYSHTSSYIRQRPSHHPTNIYAGSRQSSNKNLRVAGGLGHGAYSPVNEHSKRFDVNALSHGIEMCPNTYAQRRPSYRDDPPQPLASYQQQSQPEQYSKQQTQFLHYPHQQVNNYFQTIPLKTQSFSVQNQ